jgi:arginine:pyruvate transaminase
MRYTRVLDALGGTGTDKWTVHFRAKARRLAGEDIVLLTLGESDVPPPPELIEVACRSLRAGRTLYSNGRGEPAVLEALARKYSRRTGRTITPAQALYFPGTQTALYATMRAVAEPGTEVLVGDPLYATYEGVIAASGARCVPVPLRAEDNFHLRADALERAVTPDSRVLLLNSPHNPTGAVLSREEIRAIGEVCRRHDLWIISDEVYEALCFAGDGAPAGSSPFASPFDDPELADRTIVVSSLSKSHSMPGFRSGWCVASEEFCARLLPLSESMLFGAQPFIEDMAAAALGKDFPETAAMRAAYARRAVLLCGALEGIAGVHCLRPEGGMFAMIDLRGLAVSGQAFALRLLDERGIAVMPGEAFGAQAAGFVRISLTVPDEMLLRAAGEIRALAGELHADARPAGITT